MLDTIELFGIFGDDKIPLITAYTFYLDIQSITFAIEGQYP